MRETELSLNHQNALSVAAYSEQMRAQLFRVWLLSMQKYTAKSTKSNKFRSAPCHISCRRTAISGEPVNKFLSMSTHRCPPQ